jgi:hypothetical protein
MRLTGRGNSQLAHTGRDETLSEVELVRRIHDRKKQVSRDQITITLTDSGRPSRAEAVETIGSKKTQTNGKGLSRLDCSGNAASSKDQTGQQSQLDTVWLTVRDSHGTEGVESANRASSSDGGNGASSSKTRSVKMAKRNTAYGVLIPDIAGDTAASSQGSEDVSNIARHRD